MRNKYFCHKQSISNFSFCNKENYTKKSCLRDLPGAGPMPQFRKTNDNQSSLRQPPGPLIKLILIFQFWEIHNSVKNG